MRDCLVHGFGKAFSTPGVYLPSEYGVKKDGRQRRVKVHAKYYKTLKQCSEGERQRFFQANRDLDDPFKGNLLKPMPRYDLGTYRN